MCWDTAWTVMANGSASSLTVAGPVLSRAMSARRTGSASAANARSSRSGPAGVRAMCLAPSFIQVLP